jgi:cell division initiation protein
MPVTPLDIQSKEFRRSFRGYHPDEVNAFLDQVTHDYEAVLKENDRLREEATALQERLDQYRQLEGTIQSTLVLAQNTAEQIKAAANHEAQLVVREAEAKAREIIEQARRRVGELEAEYRRLAQEVERFRAQAVSLLEAELAILREPLGGGQPALPETVSPGGGARRVGSWARFSCRARFCYHSPDSTGLAGADRDDRRQGRRPRPGGGNVPCPAAAARQGTFC